MIYPEGRTFPWNNTAHQKSYGNTTNAYNVSLFLSTWSKIKNEGHWMTPLPFIISFSDYPYLDVDSKLDNSTGVSATFDPTSSK